MGKGIKYIKEERLEIAKKMLEDNEGISIIKKYTGLTDQEIKELYEKI